MSDGPVSEVLSNAKNLVGKYGIIYRKGKADVGRIINVDVPNRKISYELISGVDKGKTLTSKFDPTQKADLYDEDNLVLALMRTEA